MFRDRLSEISVAADPELCQPFVSYETGKAVLYVRLHKSLYGCLKSTLFFLQEASARPRGIWVQYKFIRPVRGQKYYRQETANSILARVKPQDIMRRRERGDTNDTVDRVRILRNEWVTWEETQLPGNVARSLNTGGSAHIHGIIPEEST